MTHTPRDFYERLWRTCPPGFVELQTIRPRAGQKDEAHPWFFEWPGDFGKFISKAAESSGKWNCYHGVGVFSRMRGQNEDVLAVPALWTDIDFKTTPYEKALKLLREFPLKPSLGVMSGGGFHPYWILKEPASGVDLAKIRPILLGLADALGGDLKACTLKQILRVPGSLNIKYSPPAPVKIIAWNDTEFILDDFEMFARPEPSPRPPTGGQPGDGGARAVPSKALPPEITTKVASLLTEIWIKGYRNNLSMYVAGLLAHADYSEDSALAVVRGVCSMTADEEAANRERNVRDTYTKFLEGKDVAGGATAEKMIQEQFSGIVRMRALKILEVVRRTVPKTPKAQEAAKRKAAEPDFEIVQRVRFNSIPSRWVVTIKMLSGGDPMEVAVEGEDACYFRQFRFCVFDQHRIYLAFISQIRWEEMFSDSKLVEMQAPKEARTSGAIERSLEDFMEDKRENPRIGELKSFPGFDEEKNFFSLATFKDFLRERGVRATDREVIHQLRQMGWDNAQKRFGEKNKWVWQKPHETNGHGKQELFQPPVALK